MEMLNGILTATLFLLYFILWAIKRREIIKTEGIDPKVLMKSKRPTQIYFGKLEKIMTIALAIILMLHFFFKNQFRAVEYISCLNNELWLSLGFILGIAGLAICRLAQRTMGKSWRVGIDEQSKPGLVTKGIYSYIRNPTYSGIFVTITGLLIINPTFLFTIWAVAFFLLIEFQVRCEEEYLEGQYKNEYIDYCAKTKRYIPFIY